MTFCFTVELLKYFKRNTVCQHTMLHVKFTLFQKPFFFVCYLGHQSKRLLVRCCQPIFNKELPLLILQL